MVISVLSLSDRLQYLTFNNRIFIERCIEMRPEMFSFAI